MEELIIFLRPGGPLSGGEFERSVVTEIFLTVQQALQTGPLGGSKPAHFGRKSLSDRDAGQAHGLLLLAALLLLCRSRACCRSFPCCCSADGSLADALTITPVLPICRPRAADGPRSASGGLSLALTWPDLTLLPTALARPAADLA